MARAPVGGPGPGWWAACGLAVAVLWLHPLLLHAQPSAATKNSEWAARTREPRWPTSIVTLSHLVVYLAGSGAKVPGFLGGIGGGAREGRG